MTNAMKTQKRLGIWMDHSTAHLMEFTVDPIETTTLELSLTHQEKEESLGRSEKLMHNKEQHQQADYYKKLGEMIRNYGEVVLFGPTDAKVELFNRLSADHRFAKIKIDIQQTDKMTENQQHAFVKEFYTKHLTPSHR
jgi:ADP-heptose:LPS heptosyltransferase